MSYRQVQSVNSKNRNKLAQEEIKWLRDNNYKNIGWNNIIDLYNKIEEFFNNHKFDNFTLEELFLEADRIGNKYLTSQEIREFEQNLAQEVNEIAEEIERQFPDPEIEVIDFSDKTKGRYRQKRTRKRYTTIRL